MSGLSRFLVWDRNKARMSEEGGLKTPAMMSSPVDPSLSPICVSKMDGGFLMVRNQGTGEQRTAFFDVEPEEEDQVQAELISFIHEKGIEAGWGNVATLNDVEEGLIDLVEGYFESFDLELHMIHVGPEGWSRLLEEELVDPLPEKDMPGSGKASLEKATEGDDRIARIRGRNVYYNRELSDKIVFSAEPEYVGLFTRIRDQGSVLVHNPERGMVIIRIGNQDEVPNSDTSGVEGESEEG